ncbi:hemerythrin domain-containing protein [Streptomyces sp. 184]|uniref:hemerythrin domain-containing protein n=1 Tax=Streptomyces sp. 184 TaxID=1827526 RepID=UPI0038922BD9
MPNEQQPPGPQSGPFADPERRRAAGEQLLRAHDELRRELAGVLAAADGRPAATPASAAPVSAAPVSAPALRDLNRHCLAYCASLEDHHRAEDGALGAMERQFPDLAPAVTRIRDEHRAVTAMLARVRDLAATPPPAPAAARPAPAAHPAPGGPVRAELRALAARLDAHFAYEERTLLPALGVPAPPARPAAPGP